MSPVQNTIVRLHDKKHIEVLWSYYDILPQECALHHRCCFGISPWFPPLLSKVFQLAACSSVVGVDPIELWNPSAIPSLKLTAKAPENRKNTQRENFILYIPSWEVTYSFPRQFWRFVLPFPVWWDMIVPWRVTYNRWFSRCFFAISFRERRSLLTFFGSKNYRGTGGFAPFGGISLAFHGRFKVAGLSGWNVQGERVSIIYYHNVS